MVPGGIYSLWTLPTAWEEFPVLIDLDWGRSARWAVGSLPPTGLLGGKVGGKREAQGLPFLPSLPDAELY